MMSAVATPPTSASKQTATSLRPASETSEGANALARLARENPATPAAIRRRRPRWSARVASGSAPSAPSASTDPRFERAETGALKSAAIPGSAMMSTEPSKPASTTASPAQSRVCCCARSSEITSLLDHPQATKQVWARTEKAACGGDVHDGDPKQRRRTRQQPECEAHRNPERGGDERVRPPPTQPGIDHVRRRSRPKAEPPAGHRP